MATPFNYTVAPHLTRYAVPFPTFRAEHPEYTHYVGGGLIFSRTSRDTKGQNGQNDKHSSGELRMLLLQRSFEDSYGGAWEGPGGSCDPDDETLLDGVAREVLEESGLHVSRFVELAEKKEWVRVRPDAAIRAAKFTFIVEVHEARSALPENTDEARSGLPAVKSDEDVGSGLGRRWEEMVKLDPAEHRAFEWVTEEDIRESMESEEGKFKSFANGEKAILEGFRILKGLGGV